ncbi:kirola-like [Bidens hawaiensis]|uniref:kirola-like n=1 Tax=Bidens hawaiensis TaxID=980011 RepID=UPI00404944CC
MTLRGTIAKQVTIKSDGDVFLNIYRYRTHLISQMSPNLVKAIELQDSEWGAVGSIIVWHLVIDGTPKVAKEVIQAIDEEKKSVSFKVIEGDIIMEAYRTFMITIKVDTRNEENVVTWTFDYEKVNENIGDPDNLIELYLIVAKDVENYHLLQPN